MESQVQADLCAVSVAFPTDTRTIAQGQGTAGNAVPGKGGIAGLMGAVWVVLPAVVLDSPGGKAVAVSS